MQETTQPQTQPMTNTELPTSSATVQEEAVLQTAQEEPYLEDPILQLLLAPC